MHSLVSHEWALVPGLPLCPQSTLGELSSKKGRLVLSLERVGKHFLNRRMDGAPDTDAMRCKRKLRLEQAEPSSHAICSHGPFSAPSW